MGNKGSKTESTEAVQSPVPASGPGPIKAEPAVGMYTLYILVVLLFFA
jgi:hypothetical protein